jgi:hypothetical protein
MSGIKLPFGIRIIRWKHQNMKMHIMGWVQGFMELLDGIVTVISFGTLASNFERNWSSYRAKSHINQIKKEREK